MSVLFDNGVYNVGAGWYSRWLWCGWVVVFCGDGGVMWCDGGVVVRGDLGGGWIHELVTPPFTPYSTHTETSQTLMLLLSITSFVKSNYSRKKMLRTHAYTTQNYTCVGEVKVSKNPGIRQNDRIHINVEQVSHKKD